MEALDRIFRTGVVPVVVIENSADAVPAARALLAGGIDVMEITFRTAAAADSIRSIARECPEMFVGAGTVNNMDQCRTALACGANFIVEAGFNPDVVHYCVAGGVAVVPGCVTATEIIAAMELGLRVVKFFPANICGGLPAMKALSAPFGEIRFIPTGGIHGDNLEEYLAAPFVFAVGGSWLCTRADIAAGRFERIAGLSRDARNKAAAFPGRLPVGR